MATREDWLNIDYRKKIITEIKSEENQQRKFDSFKQMEIFRDRLHKYVVSYLEGQFDPETVKELPIISSINLSKRIVEKEASIYRNEPNRTFEDVSEDQQETLEKIYDDMMADRKLLSSNQKFKIQNQNILQVLPVDRRLQLRSYWMHQIDAIPYLDNPEKASAYVISVFDRARFEQNQTTQKLSNPTGNAFSQSSMYSDGVNETIADQEDYRSALEKYVVWTHDFNFIMDGFGNVISGDQIESPIPGYLPFVDISGEKDFEFFVRQGQSITDFCIQYNAGLSDLYNIVRVQGYAQAIIKGPADLIPTQIKVGPQHIIKLGVDPNNPDVQTDFDFISPQPDIQGSLEFVNSLLSTFMTSRGVDPKTVTTTGDVRTFSSGVERMLAMVEQFEATKLDYNVYEHAESEVYELVKVWLNTLAGTGILEDKYNAGFIPEESEISISFAGPEQVQSEKEKLDNYIAQLDAGLMSKAEVVSKIRNISLDEAKNILSDIEEENNLTNTSMNNQMNQLMQQGDLNAQNQV